MKGRLALCPVRLWIYLDTVFHQIHPYRQTYTRYNILDIVHILDLVYDYTVYVITEVDISTSLTYFVESAKNKDK